MSDKLQQEKSPLLVSRHHKGEDTIINIKQAVIGGFRIR